MRGFEIPYESGLKALALSVLSLFISYVLAPGWIPPRAMPSPPIELLFLGLGLALGIIGWMRLLREFMTRS